MSTHIEAAVSRLLETRNGGAAIPTEFTVAHPLTIQDGLEVQARVQAAMGPIAAWKIAPSSTVESPNFSVILAQDTLSSPARFTRNRFRKAVIECELAFRIGRDLTNPPYTREQVADAIASLVPLFEIADTRLADSKATSMPWRLADFVSNGAVVVGPDFKDWRSVNMQQQPVSLSFNGQIVGEKCGSSNPDLVALVQLLANQAGRHCGGIRAGHVVTTGSIVNKAAGPGTEAIGGFPGLGELRASLEK